MINTGIIICLKDSINLYTIKQRTKKIVKNLCIQYETKHPINSTIGCFNAHIKALKNAINLMENNKNLNHVIIAEEDIIINYKSPYYNNIIESINEYNRETDYILHLGGFPSFTNDLYSIIENLINNRILSSRIYLTTCYIVNIKIATKLLKVLENSSRHIHCDAIFANSNIKQRLIKGNIINQLENKNSENSFLHNYLSTYNITYIFLFLNKFNVFLLDNIIFQSIIIIYYFNNSCYIKCMVEFFLIILEFIRKSLINKKYTKYLPKNFFTFIEILKYSRILTFYSY
jgi:hypothetical protein